MRFDSVGLPDFSPRAADVIDNARKTISDRMRKITQDYGPRGVTEFVSADEVPAGAPEPHICSRSASGLPIRETGASKSARGPAPASIFENDFRDCGLGLSRTERPIRKAKSTFKIGDSLLHAPTGCACTFLRDAGDGNCVVEYSEGDEATHPFDQLRPASKKSAKSYGTSRVLGPGSKVKLRNGSEGTVISILGDAIRIQTADGTIDGLISQLCQIDDEVLRSPETVMVPTGQLRYVPRGT